MEEKKGNKWMVIVAVILSILIIALGVYICYDKILSNNNDEQIETNEKESSLNEEINSVKVTINDKKYIIQLEDNETAKSFVNLLPQEYDMSELNGNEKYVYLNNTLPTNASNPKRINSGDVMLYGNNCLVIFYKSFDTSYSYTKIGHIDNLENLGNNGVTAIFEK